MAKMLGASVSSCTSSEPVLQRQPEPVVVVFFSPGCARRAHPNVNDKHSTLAATPVILCGHTLAGVRGMSVEFA